MITTRNNLYGKVSAGSPLAAQGIPCVRPHVTGAGRLCLCIDTGICEPSGEHKYDARAFLMRIVRPCVTGAGRLCLYLIRVLVDLPRNTSRNARAFFACCHKQITRVRVSFLFPDRIACHKLLFFRQKAVHLLKRGGRLFMGRTRPLHPAPDWTVPHGFLARLSARARAVRALSARAPIVPALSAPGLPAPGLSASALSVSPLSVPALATRTLIVPVLSASALPRRAAAVVRRIRGCRRAAPEPMTAEPKT